MSNDTLIARIACGAAAGLVGTFALQGIRGSSQKLLPETTPPIRGDHGECMVEQAEEVLPAETREQVPEVTETVAAKSLAVGYGMVYSMRRSAPTRATWWSMVWRLGWAPGRLPISAGCWLSG
jgi:hypothetical protein